jgi:IS5 family transposase
MQLNPRQVVVQFAHILQQDLFPRIASLVGPLSAEMELLGAVIALSPLERMIGARRSATGRPARDRAALATAFMAKAVLNLPTTRDLISRLRVDEALRQFCGWASGGAVPHESKFSRAFAEFAESEVPQQLHAAVIAATQQQRLIGHIARDSTAILVRERFPETAKQKAEAKRVKKAKKKGSQPGARKGAKHVFAKAKATERGTRIQQQRKQKLVRMLKELPRQCDIGTKTSSKGHQQYWRGYKLHLDVADGQLPISAVLTSASVHDSQVAIPLMTMTSQRVVHLYELMDSAYDADSIRAHSRQLNHVPIIAPHGRRGTKKPSIMQKVFPDKPTPELTPAQQERYKTRTMSERVNARLKDEFGANQIRVRGAVKVMAHLMFGVLALTVDQWLRMSASG